ncbi:MAG: ribosomal protein S18-alanine N-acetyltransferase [Candidatus Nezhaarchaeales archaeon]
MNPAQVNVTIRKAVPADFAQIVSVEISSFKRPYPPELMFSFLCLHSDTFYVALVGEEVVGYVVGAERRDGCGHVLSIAVKPAWRRRGLGSKLMDSLLMAFKERGLKKALLEVAVSNTEAIAFYERLCFKKVALLRGYYPWGEDAYLMSKEL